MKNSRQFLAEIDTARLDHAAALRPQSPHPARSPQQQSAPSPRRSTVRQQEPRPLFPREKTRGVVTNVDHNVHTILDPKKIAIVHHSSPLSYVGRKHRLHSFAVPDELDDILDGQPGSTRTRTNSSAACVRRMARTGSLIWSTRAARFGAAPCRGGKEKGPADLAGAGP